MEADEIDMAKRKGTHMLASGESAPKEDFFRDIKQLSLSLLSIKGKPWCVKVTVCKQMYIGVILQGPFLILEKEYICLHTGSLNSLNFTHNLIWDKYM